MLARRRRTTGWRVVGRWHTTECTVIGRWQTTGCRSWGAARTCSPRTSKKTKRERRGANRHGNPPEIKVANFGSRANSAGVPRLCAPTSRSVCLFRFAQTTKGRSSISFPTDFLGRSAGLVKLHRVGEISLCPIGDRAASRLDCPGRQQVGSGAATVAPGGTGAAAHSRKSRQNRTLSARRRCRKTTVFDLHSANRGVELTWPAGQQMERASFHWR